MPNTLEISMKIGKILGLAEATKSTRDMDHIRENMDEIIKAANEIDLHEE